MRCTVVNTENVLCMEDADAAVAEQCEYMGNRAIEIIGDTFHFGERDEEYNQCTIFLKLLGNKFRDAGQFFQLYRESFHEF